MIDTIKLVTEQGQDDYGYYARAFLSINGKVIRHFTDPFSFILYQGWSTDRQKERWENYTFKDSSEFYPFTCSCGIAGCAGIWNGIILKTRKHTAEWRMRDRVKDGYGKILDKSFYSFDKTEYDQVVKDLVEWCESNPDLDWDDRNTLGDMLEWSLEVKYE